MFFNTGPEFTVGELVNVGVTGRKPDFQNCLVLHVYGFHETQEGVYKYLILLPNGDVRIMRYDERR